MNKIEEGVIEMSDFRNYLDEQLKDEEFKKEWEDSELEYNLVRSLVAARQECHMTQKELAEKTGINQADISKIETGNANPALSTLKRLAEGMDMVLHLEFIPKNIR